MAGVRLGENERVQGCVLQAAQELGYHSMKPAQVEIILNFVRGRDVFAILPTGFGKSLCYACLPATFDGIDKKERGHTIVVVVTPLLAIMKDQVRKGANLAVIIPISAHSISPYICN